MSNCLRVLAMVFASVTLTVHAQSATIDAETHTLQQLLKKEGFTGRVEDTLEKRLGLQARPGHLPGRGQGV